MKKEYKNIQEFLDDVHGEIDLRELIVDMGFVTKDDFKGQFICCPFHDEDTPSCQIGEKFFRCYGCGKRGDSVKFIQEYYNTDFIPAVKKLAEFLNVTLKEVTYNFDGKYEKLKKEWEMYLDNMSNAPREIQSLQRNYFPQEIGYDSYINYLVFPITSKTGSILGFTKRRVNDDEEVDKNGYKRPKWKHSTLKDSLIGQCHNTFNLEIANTAMRKEKEIIVCEGPKDVIAYRRIKKDNVICVCGTSNSSNVWDLILPIDNIVLSMDGDEAGIHATIETILYLTTVVDLKTVKIICMPKGQDPYDVVTSEKGHDLLHNYYDLRIPAVDFLIKHGDKKDVKKLYDTIPEYNLSYVLKNICKLKGFSIGEARSWLDSDDNKRKNSSTNTNGNVKGPAVGKNVSEKDKLIAIINCEETDLVLDPEDPINNVEKAKRILKLKYGIEM